MRALLPEGGRDVVLLRAEQYRRIKAVLEVDSLVKLVSLSHIPGGGAHVQGEALHRNPQDGLISSPAELFKYDVVILRDVPRNIF